MASLTIMTKYKVGVRVNDMKQIRQYAILVYNKYMVDKVILDVPLVP